MRTYNAFELLKEAAKKLFFSGPTIKALTPTPLELSGHIFFGFFFELQKKSYFFLVVRVKGGKAGSANYSIKQRRSACARTRYLVVTKTGYPDCMVPPRLCLSG